MTAYLKEATQPGRLNGFLSLVPVSDTKSVPLVLVERWPERELILKKLNYYSRLKRVLAYLEDHATDPITLDQAARIACMERTSFSRFFSQAVGITFRHFLQQWRIELAVELMLKSDASLTEIAHAVGFDSMWAFEQTFKKITKLNPSSYRKHLLLTTWTDL